MGSRPSSLPLEAVDNWVDEHRRHLISVISYGSSSLDSIEAPRDLDLLVIYDEGANPTILTKNLEQRIDRPLDISWYFKTDFESICEAGEDAFFIEDILETGIIHHEHDSGYIAHWKEKLAELNSQDVLRTTIRARLGYVRDNGVRIFKSLDLLASTLASMRCKEHLGHRPPLYSAAQVAVDEDLLSDREKDLLLEFGKYRAELKGGLAPPLAKLDDLLVELRSILEHEYGSHKREDG